MSYLRHIHSCNPDITEPFLPWLIDGKTYGHVRPGFARQLKPYTKVFQVNGNSVELLPTLQGFAERSAALAEVAADLAQRGVVTSLMDEPYPVTASGRKDAVATIDRTVAAYFGLRSFGQHLNGYVRTAKGCFLWIGKRAQDRVFYPGALDNIVAGGLPYGLSLHDNLLKECWEEAGMSAELAQQAQPVGTVSYNRVTDRGLRPDVIYCYDIELPADFVPQNTDGEVESFSLMPIDEVAAIVRDTDRFKLNCNLVIIDFLLRHGFIAPHEEDYLALNTGLRQ
jgi:8-oxo-dGTP pyrophosphatase MutT (NUDIX family)